MTNLTFINVTQMALTDFTISCRDINGNYRLECMQKLLCGQMSQWLVTTGIWCLSIYLLSNLLLWLWWNHIYTRIDWESFYMRHPDLLEPWDLGPFRIFYLGDLREYRRKVYWELFVRDIAAKLMCGYITLVLLFAHG